MLELEEVIKQLQELNDKLQNLGESLWHTKLRNYIKRTRRKNHTASILGRYTKNK